MRSPRSAFAKVAAGKEDQEFQDIELGLGQPEAEPEADPKSEFGILEDEKMSFKDLCCLKIPVLKVGVIMKELILIATCNPQKLSTYSDEIVLATEMIKNLFNYEMIDSNWREAITLIKSFYDLEIRLKNEKARYILRQLYEEDIDMVIGMGIQLDNINGKPPDGVMFRIKQVTKYIRDHYLDQITEMNEEQARVNTIKEYQGIFQQRMFALIVAVGIGIANFISRFLYNKYFGDVSE